MTDSELLGQLLAVIHRDGGHYQEKHGTEKAVYDAKDIVFGLLAQLEFYQDLQAIKNHGGTYQELKMKDES